MTKSLIPTLRHPRSHQSAVDALSHSTTIVISAGSISCHVLVFISGACVEILQILAYSRDGSTNPTYAEATSVLLPEGRHKSVPRNGGVTLLNDACIRPRGHPQNSASPSPTTWFEPGKQSEKNPGRSEQNLDRLEWRPELIL